MDSIANAIANINFDICNLYLQIVMEVFLFSKFIVYQTPYSVIMDVFNFLLLLHLMIKLYKIIYKKSNWNN